MDAPRGIEEIAAWLFTSANAVAAASEETRSALCMVLSQRCDGDAATATTTTSAAVRFCAENKDAKNLLVPLLRFLNNTREPAPAPAPAPAVPAVPKPHTLAWYEMLVERRAIVTVRYRPSHPVSRLAIGKRAPDDATYTGVGRCVALVRSDEKPSPSPEKSRRKRRRGRQQKAKEAARKRMVGNGYVADGGFVCDGESESDSDSDFEPSSDEEEDDTVPLHMISAKTRGLRIQGTWGQWAHAVESGEVTSDDFEQFPFLRQMLPGEFVELKGYGATWDIRDIIGVVSVNEANEDMLSASRGAPVRLWQAREFNVDTEVMKKLPEKEWRDAKSRLCPKGSAFVTPPCGEEEEEAPHSASPARARTVRRMRPTVVDDSSDEEEDDLYPPSTCHDVRALAPGKSASDDDRDAHFHACRIFDGLNELAVARGKVAKGTDPKTLYDALSCAHGLGEIQALVGSFVTGRVGAAFYFWAIVASVSTQYTYDPSSDAPEVEDVLGDAWRSVTHRENTCWACDTKKTTVYSANNSTAKLPRPLGTTSWTPALGIQCARGVAGAAILLSAVATAAERWPEATVPQRYCLAQEVTFALDDARAVFAARAKWMEKEAYKRGRGGRW